MSSGSAEAFFDYDIEPDSLAESGSVAIGELAEVSSRGDLEDSSETFDEMLHNPAAERTARSDRVIGKFQIPRVEPLTEEEETRITERMQNGDLSARNELVERHIRLVLAIAWSHNGRGLDFTDLVQEGNLGLFRATENYRVMPGKRFSDYATPFIYGAMKNAIASKAGSVIVPRSIMDRKGNLVDVSEQLERQNGHTPTASELAEETGYSVSQVEEALEASRSGTSLNSPIGNKGREEIADLLPSQDPNFDPADALIGKSHKQKWEDLLGTELTAEERRALELRFGLEDGKEYRLHAIGKEIYPKGSPKAKVKGVPQERDTYEMYGFRLVQRALKKLRKEDDPQARLFLYDYLEYIDEHYS